MAARSSTGSSVAPLFLRFALGITFLWAGLGKVLQSMPVQGEDAAILANMGVITPGSHAAAPSGGQLAPTKPKDEPKATEPAKKEPKPAEPKPEPKPDQSKPEPEEPKSPNPDAGQASSGPVLSLARRQTGQTYTAADFPEPVNVRNVYMVALSLRHASRPPDSVPAGGHAINLWPLWAATDGWPKYFAWLSALTELVGGVFLLVGFATRFAGLMIAGNMAVAMWLSQIGPAIQKGNTVLGFIPAYETWGYENNHAYYETLLWQLLLLCGALALMCLGSGAIALDRVLFGPPNTPPPKPKPVEA